MYTLIKKIWNSQERPHRLSFFPFPLWVEEDLYPWNIHGWILCVSGAIILFECIWKENVWLNWQGIYPLSLLKWSKERSWGWEFEPRHGVTPGFVSIVFSLLTSTHAIGWLNKGSTVEEKFIHSTRTFLCNPVNMESPCWFNDFLFRVQTCT